MIVYAVLLDGCGECEQSEVLGVYYVESDAETAAQEHRDRRARSDDDNVCHRSVVEVHSVELL